MAEPNASRRGLLKTGAALLVVGSGAARGRAEEAVADVTHAGIDGTGPGWVAMGADDFENVNCDADTWVFEGDLGKCKGTPIGVFKSKRTFKNFEIVWQWRHLKPAGNSGMFMWTPPDVFEGLKPDQLPKGGIEIQVLDTGYMERYLKNPNARKPAFFSCHGDVFPVGRSKMTPFPPTSPNGSRSFPSEERSRGVGQWNHYYVRCINGEVRLWVNGKEVSGGNACDPAEGHICLESEGSPLEFKRIRIRELP